MKRIFLMMIMAMFMFTSCKFVDRVKADMPSTKEVYLSFEWEGQAVSAVYSDIEKEKKVDLMVVVDDKEYKCSFFYTADNPDVMGMILDISTVTKTGAIGFKYKNASGMCGIQNIEDIEEQPEEDKGEEAQEEPSVDTEPEKPEPEEKKEA